MIDEATIQSAKDVDINKILDKQNRPQCRYFIFYRMGKCQTEDNLQDSEL